MTRDPVRRRSAGFISAVVVFLGALATRLCFVSELRGGSYLGNVRVSDSVAYYELARRIAAGTAPFEPYWQAPLYPLLLAPFQLLFGESLQAAQWLHVSIGSLNCVLIFRLTNLLFGIRAGRVAAAVAVFYAPFWLFDAQPLPANLTMLLYLLMVLAYLRYRAGRGLAWLAGSGLLVGAAILSHGLAVFTVPVFLYDLATQGRENVGSAPRRRGCLVLFLVATVLAPAAISIRNSIAAGSPIVVSYNAGVNLYIGNHHDLERTLTPRAGYEWSAFVADSRRHGVKRPAELNRYYVDRAIDEWLESPGALLVTSMKKFLLAFSASEPKRNFPIYPLRESSWGLHALLWEWEAFGLVLFAFPGGLFLPLALLGFAWAGTNAIEGRLSGRLTSLAGWIALAHILGMVVFFPTARYRVPATALLLPYAAAMLVLLWDRLRGVGRETGRSKSSATRAAIGFVSILLIVNVVSTNVFRHPARDRAEHLYYGARWAAQQLGRTDSEELEARLVEQASEAMRIDPAYPEPVELLAMYYSVRDPSRSVALFAQLADLAPDDPKVRALMRAMPGSRDPGR